MPSKLSRVKEIAKMNGIKLTDRQARSIVRAKPKMEDQEFRIMLRCPGMTLGEIRRTLIDLERRGLVIRR